MTHEQLLVRLQKRLETGKRKYEAAGLPEYVRVTSRKRFFGSLKKQQRVSRTIAALETAVDILRNPFYRVDVQRGILLGVAESRNDKDELLQMAMSISMSDRLKACQVLFDLSLPIAKKEILKYAR